MSTGDQPPIPSTADQADEQGRKQGPWTDADPHGGVMIGAYVDGLRQGEWRHYAADGRVRSEGGFRDDEVDGAWTWYRATGGLMQRGGFRRGVKHGVWERWNAAGQPLDRGTYEDGRKVGEWQTFHPDGSVKQVKRHAATRVATSGPSPD